MRMSIFFAPADDETGVGATAAAPTTPAPSLPPKYSDRAELPAAPSGNADRPAAAAAKAVSGIASAGTNTSLVSGHAIVRPLSIRA
jgi:hypothetical protein